MVICGKMAITRIAKYNAGIGLFVLQRKHNVLSAPCVGLLVKPVVFHYVWLFNVLLNCEKNELYNKIYNIRNKLVQ